jgi:ent-kaurenoic acid hydroxylase
VLSDDVNFKLGYPKSIKELAKCRPMIDVSNSEHRHFRRLITAPIVGHKALEVYLERLEDIVINSLEELSSMKHPIELLKEMKKVSFKSIVHVFMGSSNENIIKNIGSSFSDIYNGMFSIPINAPGFTFHKALKVIHFTISQYNINFIYFFSNNLVTIILFFKVNSGSTRILTLLMRHINIYII